MAAAVESARTRRRYVEEAGWKTTSLISALAGTLVAFGAVTMLAAAAGAAGNALGISTDGVSTEEWRQAGLVAGAVSAVVIFGAFFFGGYTAGRMGRRAGARHGLLMFALSVLLIGAVTLIGWAFREDMMTVDEARSDLQAEGVPTDENTWGDIGIGVGIAAGVAMLLGSVLGGIRGDRWHGRLATAVIEHRDAVREEEIERTRTQAAVVDEAPTGRRVLDGTEAIDLRDDDRTREVSVEEERESTRAI
jgi:hypothetical protein